MSLLVTGSIGIDDVTTPHGSAEGVLGGSAVYAALAAKPYGPVRLVAVVGDDFPPAYRRVLEEAQIDLAGLETRWGSKTFRWQGHYSGDMSRADTRGVALNVLAEAAPHVPAAFADSTIVFLANTHPALQRQLLSQVSRPRLSVCDTNDLWINGEREALLETLRAVSGVIVNDAEVRMVTGKVSLIEAAEAILKLGPRFVVVKKGEHGAMLVAGSGVTVVPAYPTRSVRDPTGAGDSFAGGMLGYVSAIGRQDDEALRGGLLRGAVAASFAIEGFSVDGVARVTRDQINSRVDELRRSLRVE